MSTRDKRNAGALKFHRDYKVVGKLRPFKPVDMPMVRDFRYAMMVREQPVKVYNHEAWDQVYSGWTHADDLHSDALKRYKYTVK
jgi:hypothetical protein